MRPMQSSFKGEERGVREGSLAHFLPFRFCVQRERGKEEEKANLYFAQGIIMGIFGQEILCVRKKRGGQVGSKESEASKK